jgi:hypothetical protein
MHSKLTNKGKDNNKFNNNRRNINYFGKKPEHNTNLPLNWHLIDQSHSQESAIDK